ncbi:hypothetical protein ES703_57868 [subsurface metagenome]
MKKDKKTRTRISVTITEPYVEAMDDLVERGIYLARGEIILEALRYFFKDKGVELPYHKGT